ncbi:MAG: Rieske (2Fe-2S) protein [Anaerolineales bacterium]
MNAMPPKDKRISRGNFLSWLVKGSLTGSALLGLGMLGRFISFQSQQNPPDQYDLGLASDYPVGTHKVVTEAQAMLIHDEEGFRAISLVCPHLGCTVNVTSDGFTCPCHGSRYLPDGSLRNGPASRPLTTLRIEVNQEGHLILFMN